MTAQIRWINNELEEGTLVSFANGNTHQRACDVLNNLAKDWNMRFVKDTSLFGGYYVRPDGICYFVA